MAKLGLVAKACHSNYSLKDIRSTPRIFIDWFYTFCTWLDFIFLKKYKNTNTHKEPTRNMMTSNLRACEAESVRSTQVQVQPELHSFRSFRVTEYNPALNKEKQNRKRGI